MTVPNRETVEKSPFHSKPLKCARLRRSWHDSTELRWIRPGRCLISVCECAGDQVSAFWGLVLFGLLTYGSIQGNREMSHGRKFRYFWWGSVRLDSDPLNKHASLEPCNAEAEGNSVWAPGYIAVDAGWIEKALVISALPAFLVGAAFVRGLARLGISEFASFMCVMPGLVLVWFYGVGWLLDRWRHRRSLRRASASSPLA